MTKMTIATKFDEVVKALNGEATEMSVEEMVDFLEDRKEKATKKNGNRKPTARQEENAKLKDVFAEILTDNKEGMSVTNLRTDAKVEPFGEVTSQRATAILTQMKKEGIVDKKKDGKATIYFIVD